MRGRWPPPIPRAAPRFLEASQCPAHALAARPKRPAGRATPRAARTMSPPTRPTVATFPPKPRRGRPREGSCPLGLQLPCQSPQGWRKGKKSVRPPGTEPAITRLPYRAPSTRAGSSGTGGRGHPDAEHLAGRGGGRSELPGKHRDPARAERGSAWPRRGAPLGGQWSCQEYRGWGGCQALERHALRAPGGTAGALGWAGKRRLQGRPGVRAHAGREAGSIPSGKQEKLVSSTLEPRSGQRAAAGGEKPLVPGRRPAPRPPTPLTWQLAPETPAGQVQL